MSQNAQNFEEDAVEWVHNNLLVVSDSEYEDDSVMSESTESDTEMESEDDITPYVPRPDTRNHTAANAPLPPVHERHSTLGMTREYVEKEYCTLCEDDVSAAPIDIYCNRCVYGFCLSCYLRLNYRDPNTPNRCPYCNCNMHGN